MAKKLIGDVPFTTVVKEASDANLAAYKNLKNVTFEGNDLVKLTEFQKQTKGLVEIGRAHV